MTSATSGSSNKKAQRLLLFFLWQDEDRKGDDDYAKQVRVVDLWGHIPKCTMLAGYNIIQHHLTSAGCCCCCSSCPGAKAHSFREQPPSLFILRAPRYMDSIPEERKKRSSKEKNDFLPSSFLSIAVFDLILFLVPGRHTASGVCKNPEQRGIRCWKGGNTQEPTLRTYIKRQRSN